MVGSTNYCVSYHVVLLLGHVIYLFSLRGSLYDYRIHIYMEIVNAVHKCNKNVYLRNTVKEWSQILYGVFQNNQRLYYALLVYTFRHFYMHYMVYFRITSNFNVLYWHTHLDAFVCVVFSVLWSQFAALKFVM